MDSIMDSTRHPREVAIKLLAALFICLFAASYLISLASSHDPWGDRDDDDDGIPNFRDNCPTVHNPDQKDMDHNGIGQACDPAELADGDGDGVPGYKDNCHAVNNPDQLDRDGDGIGTACDPEESVPDPVEPDPDTTDPNPGGPPDPPGSPDPNSPDAFTLQLPNPLGCGSEGLFCVVEILINLIFTLAVVATPVMFLWGAWQLLSSGGNPEKISGAVATFKWTAIGFTGILLAGGARAVIEDALFG